MRVTAKGQVTIPADIREKAGLLPDTEVTFQVEGSTVRIVPVHTDAILGRGARLIAHLRGRGDVEMTTDEIMALTRGE
ncbi:MAG: AbrB/MazE/SpoVT family DNA-binding domain-containing protein [Phreatobacter sp.]|jgi:AbrB family looped-hinge helix DNA binding protein|uniref:AbrB/MazE/SpoVT family DNA-binding domain-containing protein n=1 Tax=Phreatobacter sp. TaxID=1966341 RepID=UPI0040370AD3